MCSMCRIITFPICCGFEAFGVDVWIIGTAWIDTSFVEEIFSLDIDSDLRDIVPRLSLPLYIKINEIRNDCGVREKVCKSIKWRSCLILTFLVSCSRRGILIYCTNPIVSASNAQHCSWHHAQEESFYGDISPESTWIVALLPSLLKIEKWQSTALDKRYKHKLVRVQ